MKSYDVNLNEDDEILIKKTLKKEKVMKNKSQNTRKSKKTKQMDLSVNEALILQQVYEGRRGQYRGSGRYAEESNDECSDGAEIQGASYGDPTDLW